MSPAETFAGYAAACRVLRGGGVTAQRIREVAARDDGVDLAALRADAAALAAAAAEADEALTGERTAAGMLAAVWRGRSASSAAALIEQQCATAAAVAAGLAEAAEVLDRLAARLGRLLEARQEAGVRILDRRAADHPRWLAAAAAVMRGSPDPTAAEVVGTQIAPYVDADIAGDWTAAMTAVSDGVAAAYRDAALALADRPPARFGLPTAVSLRAAPGLGRGPGSPASPPAVSAPLPGAAQPVAADPGMTAPAAPFAAPAGSAMPGLGTSPWDSVAADAGLAAVPPLKSPGTAPSSTGLDDDENDPEEVAEPGPEPEPEPEPEPDLEPEPGAQHEPEPAPVAVAEPEPQAQPGDEPAPLVAPATPAPAAALPAEAGFGAAGSDPDERTPCETASDALPQIGE